MGSENVDKKAAAAIAWCKHATEIGGKPWTYLLVPHDKVDDTKTLNGLIASWHMQ